MPTGDQLNWTLRKRLLMWRWCDNEAAGGDGQNLNSHAASDLDGGGMGRNSVTETTFVVGNLTELS